MSSKTVIHYDNETDFFSRFLCSYMKYGPGMHVGSDSASPQDLDMGSRRMLDHILEVGRTNQQSRILDIGCGWGSLPKRLLERGGQNVYFGMTPAAVQIDYITKNVSQDLTLLQGDFLQLNIAEIKFDTIFFNGSFCHMTDKKLALEKAKSLLAPNGVIVIQDTFFVSKSEFEKHRSNAKTRFVQDTVFGFAEIIPLSQAALESEDLNLRVDYVEDFSVHYLKTLKSWIANLRGLDHERFPLASDYIDYMKFGAAGLGSLTAELCVRIVPQGDRMTILKRNLKEVS